MSDHPFNLTELKDDVHVRAETSTEAVQKFRTEMAQLGFQQANILVHDSDRKHVLAYVKKLQGNRMISQLNTMRETKDYSEALDNMAQRRRPRGIPTLEQVSRFKSVDKRTLTRLDLLKQRVQKISDAAYDCARKLNELKQDQGNPELYYLYDEIAMLSAEVYAYGLWASSEWVLIRDETDDQ